MGATEEVLTVDVGRWQDGVFTVHQDGAPMPIVHGGQGSRMITYDVRVRGGAAEGGDCLAVEMASFATIQPTSTVNAEPEHRSAFDRGAFELDDHDGTLVASEVFHVLEDLGGESLRGTSLSTTLSVRVGEQTGTKRFVVVLGNAPTI